MTSNRRTTICCPDHTGRSNTRPVLIDHGAVGGLVYLACETCDYWLTMPPAEVARLTAHRAA